MKYRPAINATLVLSLALSLAASQAVMGQTAQTPATRPQPARVPAPASLSQTEQTLVPTVRPAIVAPVPVTGPDAPTPAPILRPVTVPAPAARTMLAPTPQELPAPALAPTEPASTPRARPVQELASSVGQTAQTPAPSAQPAVAKSPDYVEEKGFKGRVFELKYRDPASLQQVIRPLGSGFKGATISIDREFKTLTVRDFPENIATIEEAIKRLDTPQPPRPDIEFTVHVLIASTSTGSREDFPGELAAVVTQLKGALKYKSYSLMTSGIHRAKEGPGGVGNSGVAESTLFASVPTPANPIFYEYNFDSISIDSSSSPSTVQVGGFHFNMRVPLNLGTSVQYQNVGFRSPVGIRAGEKVVVGSTTMGDKGLVVVVSAKLLK
jgi:hypothetical protein